MSRASSDPETPQRNRNDVPDLLTATSLKVYVKDGKICNANMML